MKICLAGWYFHAPFLEAIAGSGYEAFMVKNRDGNSLTVPSELSARMSDTGGRGLEFGCYQQYLANHWDGESDVLFLQDDGEITSSTAFGDAEALTGRGIDQAFIFRDEYEEFVNAGHSGRAFWMRGSLLGEMKRAGGFDVDWNNCGDTVSRAANFGIHMLAKRFDGNPRCGWAAIIPGIQMGRRGWIPSKPYQYKRTNGNSGLVTPQSEL